jgi:hypothetical protein
MLYFLYSLTKVAAATYIIAAIFQGWFLLRRFSSFNSKTTEKKLPLGDIFAQLILSLCPCGTAKLKSIIKLPF